MCPYLTLLSVTLFDKYKKRQGGALSGNEMSLVRTGTRTFLSHCAANRPETVGIFERADESFVEFFLLWILGRILAFCCGGLGCIPGPSWGFNLEGFLTREGNLERIGFLLFRAHGVRPFVIMVECARFKLYPRNNIMASK